MSGEQSGKADYYRACATEMMTKAQAAPSQAVRRAYLNLALNWVREAVLVQQSEVGPSDHGHWPAADALPKSR